jgi:tetrapyrrole methylase family protein/MazG family protein
MKKESRVAQSFGELIAVMDRLRGEGGCPWDREQTHESLKSFLLEETYELMEAIERGEPLDMQEELGDLLYQILFHCRIASEKRKFTMEDVLSRLKEKLVRRHPHVFSDKVLTDTGEVLRHWGEIKAKESRDKNPAQPRSSLEGVPRTMPALARAQRVTERASYFGFDWADPAPVWKKIDEEWSELKEAVASGIPDRVKEEMGDLLFSLVNLARHLGVHAEEALAQSTDRFVRRFTYIETKIREKGKTLAESSLEEMDSLWDEAKKAERRGT